MARRSRKPPLFDCSTCSFTSSRIACSRHRAAVVRITTWMSFLASMDNRELSVPVDAFSIAQSVQSTGLACVLLPQEYSLNWHLQMLHVHGSTRQHNRITCLRSSYAPATTSRFSSTQEQELMVGRSLLSVTLLLGENRQKARFHSGELRLHLNGLILHPKARFDPSFRWHFSPGRLFDTRCGF